MSDLQWPLFPGYAPLVSAEQNLEEFPLFELKARKRGTKARVFEKEVRGEGGVSLNQVWKVMPSGEYGMPGPLDQDVLLAVWQLLQQRGGMPQDGEIGFSLYELRKILGWSDDSGGAYREIRDSLLRIATTSMQSRNAFYSAEEKRRIVDTFNIWSVHFAEHEIGGHTVRERHVLRFHPIFIRNYMAQYLRGIDSDFYWSLRSPVSKRLYRLVDLQRAGGLSWKTDLLGVRDQIPLDYRYPSQIKRALQKAHAELIERRFLSGVEHEGKIGVTYNVSRGFARRQKARELSGGPKEAFAVERLIREGVDGEAARELVVTRGPDRCLFYAGAVGHQRGVSSRAGWIVSAIKEGWTVRGAAQQTAPWDTPRDPLQDPLPEPPQPGEDAAPHPPPEPDAAAAEAWGSVLRRVSDDVGDPSLGIWFDGLVPVAISDVALTVWAPNPFAKEYVETRFQAALESALEAGIGDGARLLITHYP